MPEQSNPSFPLGTTGLNSKAKETVERGDVQGPSTQSRPSVVPQSAESRGPSSEEDCRKVVSRLRYQLEIVPSEIALERNWRRETLGEFERLVAVATRDFLGGIAAILVRADSDEKVVEFCSDLLAIVTSLDREYAVVLAGGPAEACSTRDLRCSLIRGNARVSSEPQATLTRGTAVIQRYCQQFSEKLDAVDFFSEDR